GDLSHCLATTVGGQEAYASRCTPNLSVVSPEGRAVRRPRHWQPLTSFLHHSDWHLRALTCSPREAIHAPTRCADAPPHGDAVGARGKVLPARGAEGRPLARRSLRRALPA